MKTYLETIISSLKSNYGVNPKTTKLIDIKTQQEFNDIPNDTRGISVFDKQKTKLFMLDDPKALIVHDDIIRELTRLGFNELFLFDNAIGVVKFNKKLYLAESYGKEDFYAIEDTFIETKNILKNKFNITLISKPKEGFYQ